MPRTQMPTARPRRLATAALLAFALCLSPILAGSAQASPAGARSAAAGAPASAWRLAIDGIWSRLQGISASLGLTSGGETSVQAKRALPASTSSTTPSSSSSDDDDGGTGASANPDGRGGGGGYF